MRMGRELRRGGGAAEVGGVARMRRRGVGAVEAGAGVALSPLAVYFG